MKHEENGVKKIFIGLLCGLLIGGINGFFGGGGGMICVPFLLLLGLSNKKAHATAILVMLPISIASGIVYYSHGFIDFNISLWVSIGSTVGAIAGAFLLKKIPNKALSYIFPFVMVAAGIKMLF